MKVIILAGGKGARLRPLTFSIPKPLIPICETPILEILINNLKSQGFKDIILSVGYKSDLIETYFKDGKKLGVKISYSRESKKMGTAAPLKIIKKEFNITDSVLVMNGDLFTKINFKKMLKDHKKKGADITVGTKEEKIKTKYGVYNLKDGKIINIKEKPTFKLNISAGINIINPDIIDMIPSNKVYDMPALINDALKNKKNVCGYNIKEFWMAVDRLVDLEEASKIIKLNK